jgi:uncharacterized membrane protein YoaK (UPF0700 family)
MQRPDRPRLALAAMITLTFVTGVVDAVGFLGLDRVFTGNMTGNIVILGMGVAGADELPVFGPAVALVGFTAGAFAAGLALHHRRAGPPSSGWDDRITILLTLGAVVLLGSTIAVAVAPDSPGPHLQVLMATAIAAVMGQQAVVARRLAVKDMTTVVVTSTLASLAGETWVRGISGAVVNRRFAAIAVIFLGALAGALLLKIHMAVPLALATACTLVVVSLGHVILHERVRHHPNLVGTESN